MFGKKRTRAPWTFKLSRVETRGQGIGTIEYGARAPPVASQRSPGCIKTLTTETDRQFGEDFTEITVSSLVKFLNETEALYRVDKIR